MTHTASPKPNAARTGAPVLSQSTASAARIAAPKTSIRRCPAACRSPRFHASSGPKGMAMSSGTISGPNVILKYGAPTEILAPVMVSRTNG